MKLYKSTHKPAGERWRSSKSGLTVAETVEVELPKEGRAGMAAFLNANELELVPKDGGPEPGFVNDDNNVDILAEAERRAVEAQRSRTEAVQRDWDATDIVDFVLNRATVGHAESIFAALGTRFKELAKTGE